MSDSLQPHELQHAKASLSITNPWSPPKPMSIESIMPSNHLCRPLLLLPQSFPASESFPMSQLFASGGQNTGSFSFNISPSNEHPGLIYFRMDWLDLLAVQESWESSQESSPTPQFKSINSLALRFLFSLSHVCMTTGKTIALTRWTFVGKVMSLLFNMLSRLVITL